jgi:hypothetical protein
MNMSSTITDANGGGKSCGVFAGTCLEPFWASGFLPVPGRGVYDLVSKFTGTPKRTVEYQLAPGATLRQRLEEAVACDGLEPGGVTWDDGNRKNRQKPLAVAVFDRALAQTRLAEKRMTLTLANNTTDTTAPASTTATAAPSGLTTTSLAERVAPGIRLTLHPNAADAAWEIRLATARVLASLGASGIESAQSEGVEPDEMELLKQMARAIMQGHAASNDNTSGVAKCGGGAA